MNRKEINLTIFTIDLFEQGIITKERLKSFFAGQHAAYAAISRKYPGQETSLASLRREQGLINGYRLRVIYFAHIDHVVKYFYNAPKISKETKEIILRKLIKIKKEKESSENKRGLENVVINKDKEIITSQESKAKSELIKLDKEIQELTRRKTVIEDFLALGI